MKKEIYLEITFGKGATPISGIISKAIEKGTINLDSEQDLDEFIKDLQNLQETELGRETSLNILNINNGKNTIEFRTANSSINPETWIENIKLFGSIVQTAERLAQIEKKDQSELTEEDKRLLNLMEQLKEEKPEHEKMEVLLEMLFTEEERIVYRERYDENSKKIEEEVKRGNTPLAGMKFAEKVEFKKKIHDIGEFLGIANQNTLGNYVKVTSETRSGVISENLIEKNTEERDED